MLKIRSRWITLLLCIFFFLSSTAQQYVSTEQDSICRIAFYNTENCFSPLHDSLNNDWDFTPNGNYHWNWTKYSRKISHIAKVLTNLHGWHETDLIGLAEIEDSTCLEDLCHRFQKNSYKYIHYESPDKRGIDVALLYRPRTFSPIISRAISIDLGSDKTRDILYVKGVFLNRDTMHLFVCHLPSQLGGKKASDWKRAKAYAILTQRIDSIYHQNEQAKIIVLGDMNSEPVNNIPMMNNKMLEMAKNGLGTHKYKGVWTCLDQFFVSTALDKHSKAEIYSAPYLLQEDTHYLGQQPKRTFIGFRYQSNGFSDHLPILLYIYK